MNFTKLLTFCFFALGPSLVACGGAEDDPSEITEEELRAGGFGATGDACSITLPGGTKEPGKENDKGECCSELHPDKCEVILKPFPSGSLYLSR